MASLDPLVGAISYSLHNSDLFRTIQIQKQPKCDNVPRTTFSMFRCILTMESKLLFHFFQLFVLGEEVFVFVQPLFYRSFFIVIFFHCIFFVIFEKKIKMGILSRPQQDPGIELKSRNFGTKQRLNPYNPKNIPG